MMKQSLIVFVLFLAGSKAQDLLTCYNGTVGYDAQGAVVFQQDLNFVRCRAGEMCGRFDWVDAETNAFLQTGFCTREELTSCDALNPYVAESQRSSCNYSTCNTQRCNNFMGPICASGSQIYNGDSTAVILSFSTSYAPGPVGDQCYRYSYSDPSGDYLWEFGLFESALRNITNGSITDCAAVLNSLPNVTNITSCSYIAQDFYSTFTIPLPTSSGYRCNQGVIVYSVDRDVVYSADNFTNNPCGAGDLCGMFRFVNTNKANETAYVESGFCIAPSDAANLTCGFLNGFPGVNEVSNCTFSACSGDYCEEFDATAVLPGCPTRPTEEEIQLLPGCSAGQILTGAASCFGEVVGGFTNLSDPEQCRNNLDNAVSCMSDLAQTCVRFSERGQLCNSVINRIPNVSRQNLTAIFRMIEFFANNITSAESLQQLVGVLLRESGVDPSMFMMDPCSFPSLTDILLQAINNIRDMNFNVTLPICQDNQIGEDLIRLGLDYARQIVTSDSQQSACAAFDTLKEQFQDLIINRCGLLQAVRPLLSNIIGPDFAMMAEGRLGFLRDFFNNIQFPGCGGNEDDTQVELPDCSRFYNEQGTCAATQAWMCDYVTWKIEFLTVWLRRFYQYAQENMIPIPVQLPGCLELERENLCVNNREARCVSLVDGCEFCFCRDINYRDIGRVREVYRRDWSNWRRAFQLYRDFTPSDTCSVN